jgi:hypothetical protein
MLSVNCARLGRAGARRLARGTGTATPFWDWFQFARCGRGRVIITRAAARGGGHLFPRFQSRFHGISHQS